MSHKKQKNQQISNNSNQLAPLPEGAAVIANVTKHVEVHLPMVTKIRLKASGLTTASISTLELLTKLMGPDGLMWYTNGKLAEILQTKRNNIGRMIRPLTAMGLIREKAMTDNWIDHQVEILQATNGTGCKRAASLMQWRDSKKTRPMVRMINRSKLDTVQSGGSSYVHKALYQFISSLPDGQVPDQILALIQPVTDGYQDDTHDGYQDDDGYQSDTLPDGYHFDTLTIRPKGLELYLSQTEKVQTNNPRTFPMVLPGQVSASATGISWGQSENQESPQTEIPAQPEADLPQAFTGNYDVQVLQSNQVPATLLEMVFQSSDFVRQVSELKLVRQMAEDGRLPWTMPQLDLALGIINEMAIDMGMENCLEACAHHSRSKMVQAFTAAKQSSHPVQQQLANTVKPFFFPKGGGQDPRLKFLESARSMFEKALLPIYQDRAFIASMLCMYAKGGHDLLNWYKNRNQNKTRNVA